jgi:phage portal protein BeeE
VFACLQAIASAVAEPELAVYRVGPGERTELEDSALGALLARPNPHMSMDSMLGYLATCLHVDGNAYWRKLRSGDAETGPVAELWPISPLGSRRTRSSEAASSSRSTLLLLDDAYLDLLPSATSSI